MVATRRPHAASRCRRVYCLPGSHAPRRHPARVRTAEHCARVRRTGVSVSVPEACGRGQGCQAEAVLSGTTLPRPANPNASQCIPMRACPAHHLTPAAQVLAKEHHSAAAAFGTLARVPRRCGARAGRMSESCATPDAARRAGLAAAAANDRAQLNCQRRARPRARLARAAVPRPSEPGPRPFSHDMPARGPAARVARGVRRACGRSPARQPRLRRLKACKRLGDAATPICRARARRAWSRCLSHPRPPATAQRPAAPCAAVPGPLRAPRLVARDLNAPVM